MNRIREWGALAEAGWQRLSSREKVMVSGMAGFFLLLIVGGIFFGFTHAVRRHEKTIESKTKALADIDQLASTYGERSRARQQLEQRLRAKVALFTFIDDVSKKKHIEIGGIQDRGSTTGQDKVIESTVEIDLKPVTLDRLTNFMNAIEHDPHLIKVKQIRMRARIDDPNSVDASMTIAAYSSAGAT